MEISKERIIKVLEALQRHLQLSSEPVYNPLHLSAIEQLRYAADRMESKDRAVQSFYDLLEELKSSTYENHSEGQ
jgi:hypothetical protein